MKVRSFGLLEDILIRFRIYLIAARATGKDIPERSYSEIESSVSSRRTIRRWTASENTLSTRSRFFSVSGSEEIAAIALQ